VARETMMLASELKSQGLSSWWQN